MNFFVIGKDKRSEALKSLYEKESRLTTDISIADVIITSVPMTRDLINVTGTDFKIKELLDILEKNNKILISGSIPLKLKEELLERKIEYYDLMQIENLTIKNAVATAEGAICTAIQNSKITLKDSNVLVTGYGRIGKILSNILRGFNSNIYVEARKEKDLAYIEAMGFNKIDLLELDNNLPKFDFIFNTIPSIIFDESRLRLLKKDVTIIDLASEPGGVDFSKARELNFNVDWALSLPGKYSPKSAAKYFYDEISKIVK